MHVYYIGFPVLLLAAVIDASVLVQLRYLNGQPSLLLMLVVSWALLNDISDALPWAVMGGVLADLLSVTPTGTTSLALSLVVLAVTSIFGRVSRRNVVLPPLAVSMGTVIYVVVLVAVLVVAGWSIPPGGAALRWLLPSLAFNFIGILIIFRIMGALVEFFRPPAAQI
jgi:rod shape-determining protein MreD